MQKLTFDFAPQQIEINGIVFDIRVSDAEIIQTALDTAEEFKALATDDPAAVLAAVARCQSYIDAMLGEGALASIANGRPVNLVSAIKIMTEIALTVVSTYNQKIEDDYAL